MKNNKQIILLVVTCCLLFLAGIFFSTRINRLTAYRTAQVNYNHANALFYEGYSTQNTALWEDALRYYDSALLAETRETYREKIENNRAVVAGFLEDPQSVPDPQSEQQESDENEHSESSDQDGEDGQDGEQGEDQDGSDQSDQQDGSEQQDGSDGENGSSTQSISPEQRAQLEQYQQFLQEQQTANQNSFSPLPSSLQDQPQSFLDLFFPQESGLAQQLPVYEGVRDW